MAPTIGNDMLILPALASPVNVPPWACIWVVALAKRVAAGPLKVTSNGSHMVGLFKS